MTATVNASTTSGLVVTSDTSGSLALQTAGTTALTISSAQVVSLANALPVLSGGTGSTTLAGANIATTTSSTQSITSINTFGFKNRIINGGMVIDQRNAGAAWGTSINDYGIDRWGVYQSTTGKLNGGQNYNSISLPNGFTNYAGIQSQSAYSVSGSNYYLFQQLIEGFNIADLGWGTANAKTVTLSFLVQSSLTGTFGGAIQNNAANRSYPFTYSIPVANVWTTISITIVGDTSGTWLTTNGTGIIVRFGLGIGSTLSGTAGSWASATYYSATGATSVVGTSGATWYVTGVQLEVGTQATSFDFRDYGRELIMCQRYFQRVGPNNGYQEHYALGTCRPAEINTLYAYKVTMRSAPSVTVNDYTLLNVFNGAGITATCVGYVESYISPTTCLLGISVANGTFTAGTSGYVYLGNGATISFSSEL